MDSLKELILFVNKQKVAKIEVMGNPSNYSGKMKKLYEGIIIGKYQGDGDALLDLYGTTEPRDSYQKLKYRLKQRLINTIFFIDVNKPSFDETQKAYYSSQRYVNAVDILLGRGARKTAIDIAEKSLRITMKFEFTDLSLNLLRRLTRHYTIMEHNPKKMVKYNTLFDDYMDVWEAEALAEKYYTRLQMYSIQNAIITDTIKQEGKKYSRKLEQFVGKVKSNRFITFSNLMFILLSELQGNYDHILRISDNAIESLQKKKNLYKIGIYAFRSKKINYHILWKNYKEAEEEIEKALDLIPEGKINWFITYEKYLRVSFHRKDYQKAYETFMKVSVDYGFQPVYKNIVEIWKIYEAYFNFFIQNFQIDLSKSKYQPGKKFRISKFLNEVPTYSADKRGYNIPILIIQVLFLLQQKNYNRIIDKVEALHAYCYRHLKKDDTFRSNCFIKMLLLLPKCDFHRVAVERKSKVLQNKLASVPLEIITRQSAEIEIVPYEDLWEIVMDMLDDKFHKARK